MHSTHSSLPCIDSKGSCSYMDQLPLVMLPWFLGQYAVLDHGASRETFSTSLLSNRCKFSMISDFVILYILHDDYDDRISNWIIFRCAVVEQVWSKLVEFDLCGHFSEFVIRCWTMDWTNSDNRTVLCCRAGTSQWSIRKRCFLAHNDELLRVFLHKSGLNWNKLGFCKKSKQLVRIIVQSLVVWIPFRTNALKSSRT